MNESTPSVAAPPHPFREPAWYDASVEHRPCMCPRCRSVQGRATLRPFRIALVVAGGLVLPLVSLLVNESFRVVHLGFWGTCAFLVAAAGAVANLVLSPTRRDPVTRVVEVDAPRSTVARVLLLGAALWGTLVWGYLALLFVPLLPLSVIAIAFFGIGLCGLCPFGALVVAVVQARRAYRAVAERLGRRVRVLAAAMLLGPIVVGAAAGLIAYHRQCAALEALATAQARPPHSSERLRAVAGLAGKEALLPGLYISSADQARRELLAEAYLLLTDERMHAAVEQAAVRHRALIQPWWFLEGRLSFPIRDRLWRF